MGQSEVIEFLEGRSWTKTMAIAKGLNQESNLVCRSLAKLYDYEEVQRRDAERGYEWKILE